MQQSRWAPKPAAQAPAGTQPSPPTTRENTDMTAKQAPGPVSALADSVANLAVDKHSSSGENPAPEQVQTESAATEITGEAAPTEEAIASYVPSPYDDDPTAAFAQTASADDLFFDDDIVPVEQPVVEQPIPEPPAPVAPEEKRNGHGGFGGNKRGGGNRGRGANFNNYKPKGKDDEAPAAKSTSPDVATKEPLTSEDTTKPHVPAASGNRLLTGGPPRKPKLKEDSRELAAIMAAAAKKNAARIAQFEREQADLAESEAREAQAARRNEELKKKRAETAKIERQNRLEMMGEREKNARRKLAAAQGREWDREKEDGFTGNVETKKPAAMRGMHGGVVSSPPAPAPAPTPISRAPENKENSISLPSPAAEGASWADQVEGN